MSYKYEKFEKLSDAVKWEESGNDLYFEHVSDEDFKVKKERWEHFCPTFKYYRRIEVKPFECEIYFFKTEPFQARIDGAIFHIVPYEGEVMNEYTKSIKMREVIEG